MNMKQNKIISLLLALCLCLLLIQNVNGAADTGAASFAKDVRTKMIARQTEIPLTFRLSDAVLQADFGGDTNAFCDAFFDELFAEVYKHDGTYKGGDYLKKHTDNYGLSLNYTRTGDDPDWTVNAVLHITYFTTAAQEETVEDTLDKVIAGMALDGLTDYQKLQTVYNYLSAIRYDYTNLEDDSYTLKYSAYAALIDRTAVCQGYANLFYLFMQRLGIDCRIISGWGLGEGGKYEAHAWNIVKLGKYYYNCDATWDEGAKTFQWFLKGSSDFPKHIADDEYTTDAFKAAYPIAEKAYSEDTPPAHQHVPVTVAAMQPTCTQEGHTEKIYCSTCGAVIKESSAIPSLGHDLKTEVIKEPTRTEYGESRTYCTRCTYSVTAILPMLTEEPAVYLPGDADNDGTVTASDARLALRCAVKLEDYAPDSPEFIACDTDHNGSITAADARSILRAAVKLETLS